VDSECGGRDKATCERLIEQLTRWRTRLYCADDYAVYDVLLPAGQLHTGTRANFVSSGATVRKMRVLGEHRQEVGDPVVSGEAGEQGDADVHHPLGLRDHDGAPSEARQPMPLAGVVPLDAVRFLLARVELSNRQEHAVDGVVVRAVEPGAPARQALKEALASGFVTTAAFPVHQPP